VQFDSLRSIAGMILALYAQPPLVAQEKTANPQPTAVSVPFVGCKYDGQIGPLEVPKGTSISVPISLRAAQKLAYYSAFGQEDGVLAPRGWYCFGTYGSGGSALLVSSQRIDTATMFSTWDGLSGPVIAISNWDADTSGRFQVAEIIARVFPAYKLFVTNLTDSFLLPASEFTFGPYPKDTLTYKSNRAVEYKTPAQTDGLGTHLWLKKNGSPIEGVAMLVGQTPDLLLVSVRLPAELGGLTSVIVRQVELDAQRSDRH
jgi:hypothetical protein